MVDLDLEPASIPSDGQRQLLAYQIWEQARHPVDDGRVFWMQADALLLGDDDDLASLPGVLGLKGAER